MSIKVKETRVLEVDKDQKVVYLKYTGKKTEYNKVCFKGVCFELTNGVFEMPDVVAKAFLADGNSKAFKEV